MKTFRDDCGRDWKLSITIGAVKRLKATLPGVDLLKLDEPYPAGGSEPLSVRLWKDVELRCDVLFVLLQLEAEKQAVSDFEFAEGMGGDGLTVATKALYEELTDFFQKVGHEHLAQVIATQELLVRKVTGRTAKRIQEMDLDSLISTAEGEAALAQRTPATPGKPSTKSPGSSESSPTL